MNQFVQRSETEVKAKVKELGGWFDKEYIRFPSVDACEQFKKWRWSGRTVIKSSAKITHIDNI